MKNYCRIEVHGMGCDRVKDGIINLNETVLALNQSIITTQESLTELSNASNYLPETKRGSNLTPKKKKRKR